MKYLIKQKLIKIYRESFYIYDENGNKLFKIKPKFSVKTKYHFEDMQEKHILTITSKIFDIMPKFYIENSNNEQIAYVKKKFSIKPKFEIDHKDSSKHYTITGDIFSYNFNILMNETVIATVHKQFYTIRDAYEVDVLDKSETYMCLALAIIIDNAQHKQDSKLNFGK